MTFDLTRRGMTSEEQDGRMLPRKPGGSLNKIEEKYEEVGQLILLAKEKGYLDYEDVNEILPEELTGSEEIETARRLLEELPSVGFTGAAENDGTFVSSGFRT